MNRFIPIDDGDVLSEGKIKPQKGHGHQEDTNVVKMHRLDIVLEVVGLSEHRHHDNHACHPGEDGADNEIGTKNRTVPQRLDGHGKDKRDNGMDGDHDRDHEDRHETDRPIQPSVLAFRPGPSQGQNPVEPLPFSSKIPEQGDVRD